MEDTDKIESLLNRIDALKARLAAFQDVGAPEHTRILRAIMVLQKRLLALREAQEARRIQEDLDALPFSDDPAEYGKEFQ